jgi:hypothetical protein
MSLQFEQDRQCYSKQPERNLVQQCRISRTEIISLPDIGVKCQHCMKDTSRLAKFQNSRISTSRFYLRTDSQKNLLKEEKISLRIIYKQHNNLRVYEEKI